MHLHCTVPQQTTECTSSVFMKFVWSLAILLATYLLCRQVGQKKTQVYWFTSLFGHFMHTVDRKDNIIIALIIWQTLFFFDSCACHTFLPQDRHCSWWELRPDLIKHFGSSLKEYFLLCIFFSMSETQMSKPARFYFCHVKINTKHVWKYFFQNRIIYWECKFV